MRLLLLGLALVFAIASFPSTESACSADLRSAVPALDKYRHGVLRDLWKRADLSKRECSIATVSALIARNQEIEMPEQFSRALDNGVKPGELSEIRRKRRQSQPRPRTTSLTSSRKSAMRSS